ncbi:hypothetical protein ACH5RR_026714 [Cinchona calisaya]|uniref:F-box domain-containing protein n=1 Tax=Cinchona calisaya TaxID=153742 RepID=A0ABD2Z6J1_9GENT
MNMMETNTNKPSMVQSEQTILPQIPQEIIYAILSRLPEKSLARFSCVCKLWHSLIGRERGFFYLLPKEGKIRFFSSNKELVVEELPSPLENGVLRDACFRFHGSCNGLLIFSLANSIYLWNPSTRWCKEVLQIQPSPNKKFIPICGLCYDDSTDDYKLLIPFQNASGRVDENFVTVTSLRSKESRKVSFPYATVMRGCSANGRLHWIVQEYKYFIPLLIVYFDTKTNEFVKLPMPEPPFRLSNQLQIGVVDGCLGMARGEDDFVFSYGAEESWSTIFRWRKKPKIKKYDGWSVGVPVPGTSKELLAAKFRHTLSMNVWDMKKCNLFKSIGNIDKWMMKNHFDNLVWETYYETLACPDTSSRLLLEDEINILLD